MGRPPAGCASIATITGRASTTAPAGDATHPSVHAAAPTTSATVLKGEPIDPALTTPRAHTPLRQVTTHPCTATG